MFVSCGFRTDAARHRSGPAAPGGQHGVGLARVWWRGGRRRRLPRPGALRAPRRTPPGRPHPAARTGSTTLTITNTGRRTAPGVVRDAWQPSAGASNNRHRIRSPAWPVPTSPADCSHPTRRPADRPGHRANARPPRTGRPTGALKVPGTLRVPPAFPSISTCPAGSPGCASSTAGPRCGCAAGNGVRPLREYVSGDDVRSVDWRASARSRSVVVRPGSPSATAASCSSSTPAAPRPGAWTTLPGWTRRWTPRCCWPPGVPRRRPGLVRRW